MRPSDLVKQYRPQILALVRQYQLENPRVIGSIARGEDEADSDFDLLVTAPPGTTLLQLGGLQDHLHSLLKIEVDVITDSALPEPARADILGQARAL